MTLHTALFGASKDLPKDMYFSWSNGHLLFNIKHSKSDYFTEIPLKDFFVHSTELTIEETTTLLDICRFPIETLSALENWQVSYTETEEPCECECCGHQHSHKVIKFPKISEILPKGTVTHHTYFHKPIRCLDTNTTHIINDVHAYGTNDLGGAWAKGEDGTFSWVTAWELLDNIDSGTRPNSTTELN